eukprot:TRINITY_DN1484_c0_g2_i1.p1 TRINITY_DN1484_c0_g2~~TRINITY_DN1484_c0_g2_i1.p1  ORF type:complete len:479 (-),score=131.09 TRINITY_DN1484_c0_g2_i1:243-1679(-)
MPPPAVPHLTSLADVESARACEPSPSIGWPSLVFERSEYLSRVRRVREAMRSKGIDTLVLAGPDNLFYLSGFDGWSYYTPQYLIVHDVHDGEEESSGVQLVCRGMDVAAARFTSWLAPCAVWGYEDSFVDNTEQHPAELVLALMHQLGWHQGTVGLEDQADFLTARAYSVFVAGLDRVVSDQRLVNWVRSIKSEPELVLIREAASTTDAVLEAAIDALQPGVRQCDVAAAIMHAQATGTEGRGGTFTAIAPIISTGSDTDTGHLNWSDAAIPAQSHTCLELASARQHYHAPCSRTVYLGTPPPAMAAFAALCYAAMEAMLALCVPGAVCEDLFAAFNAVLATQEASKASRVGYSFGIGFAPDWGEKTLSVRPGNKTVLVEGMCLHLIAGCGDAWGFQTSETVHITGGSPERFQSTARKLFVKNHNVMAVEQPVVEASQGVPTEDIARWQSQLGLGRDRDMWRPEEVQGGGVEEVQVVV